MNFCGEKIAGEQGCNVSKETYLVKDGGGLEQGGSKKVDRKWSDSRYILKMNPTEFSEELNAGYMRKREIKG